MCCHSVILRDLYFFLKSEISYHFNRISERSSGKQPHLPYRRLENEDYSGNLSVQLKLWVLLSQIKKWTVKEN